MSKHSKHEEKHEVHHSASAKPVSDNQNQLLIVGALILGLIIGGAIVAFGMGFGANDSSKLNVSELQPKVSTYLNNNFLSPDAVAQGLSFVVEDNNKIVGGLAEFSVYAVQDGEKQLAGLVYANNEKLVIAQGEAFDLNESLPGSEDTTPAPVETKKSDNPLVELFIWSYCPYGVTALDPFADVAKLIGDKTEFKVALYYDGHGAYETQQNKTQACIQKYAKDKYWDYAKAFASDIYPVCGSSGDINCDKTESIALMDSLGINSTEIFSCVESEGASLIAADSLRAQSLGVTGSPTLAIDGVKVSVARTAEAYKTAVCNTFNTAPEACSDVLSNAAATTSGSC